MKAAIEAAFRERRPISTPAAPTCWICGRGKSRHRYMLKSGATRYAKTCTRCDTPEP